MLLRAKTDLTGDYGHVRETETFRASDEVGESLVKRDLAEEADEDDAPPVASPNTGPAVRPEDTQTPQSVAEADEVRVNRPIGPVGEGPGIEPPTEADADAPHSEDEKEDKAIKRRNVKTDKQADTLETK